LVFYFILFFYFLDVFLIGFQLFEGKIFLFTRCCVVLHNVRFFYNFLNLFSSISTVLYSFQFTEPSQTPPTHTLCVLAYRGNITRNIWARAMSAHNRICF
jgi:hypothetical protein